MKIMILLVLPLTVLTINTRRVSAICKCEIEVASNIMIDGKKALFLPGQEVNAKMKVLAGDDPYTWSYGAHFYANESITAFLKSNTEPTIENKEDKNIVSTDDLRTIINSSRTILNQNDLEKEFKLLFNKFNEEMNIIINTFESRIIPSYENLNTDLKVLFDNNLKDNLSELLNYNDNN